MENFVPTLAGMLMCQKVCFHKFLTHNILNADDLNGLVLSRGV